MEKLHFRPRLDLSPYLGLKSIIITSLSFDESLLVLASHEPDRELSNRIAPKGNSPYELSFLKVSNDGSIFETGLITPNSIFCSVQDFVDGSILLTESPDPGDPSARRLNGYHARVYTKEGILQNEFAIGGAIDAQVSATGEIWTKYYDEAIVGAGIASFPRESVLEAQASGLGCFSRLGELVYSYIPPPGFEHMVDCYTLNVVRDVAWVCYYPNFPLVSIGPNKTASAWKNETEGATALALRDELVLMFGGYQHLHKRCVLQSIGANSQLGWLAEFEAVLPEGAASSAVIGRGSKLCVVANAIWYELSFDDIA